MLVLLSVFGLKSRLIIRNTYMDLFYIPPNSGQQIWEELEQSIGLALNSSHAIIDNNTPF
jgi:hypothetical protein